jgi:hypothetical protein
MVNKFERIFNGQVLTALVELGRLLNCSGAKLETFLRRFNPIYDTEKVFPDAATRTYTNELRRHGITAAIRKVDSGVIGIHSVPIVWTESKSVRVSRSVTVGPPKSKKQKATLLAIASRSTNTYNYKTNRREYDIQFAILPKKAGTNLMTDIISAYVIKHHNTKKQVKQIFLVCDKNSKGQPFAMLDVELLALRLKEYNVKVEYDVPTATPEGTPFEIKTALSIKKNLENDVIQRHETVLENYIAIVMKKTQIPERTVDWDEIRSECHDESRVKQHLEGFNPYLIDHNE